MLQNTLRPSINNAVNYSLLCGVNVNPSASLPTAGLIGKWLAPGMTDSIGLLITRDQVDPALADIFFDGESKRADEDIFTLALASPLLNYGTMLGTSGVVALYALDTPAITLDRAGRAVNSIIRGTQFQAGEIFQFQDGSPMAF